MPWLYTWTRYRPTTFARYHGDPDGVGAAAVGGGIVPDQVVLARLFRMAPPMLSSSSWPRPRGVMVTTYLPSSADIRPRRSSADTGMPLPNCTRSCCRSGRRPVYMTPEVIAQVGGLGTGGVADASFQPEAMRAILVLKSRRRPA